MRVKDYLVQTDESILPYNQYNEESGIMVSDPFTVVGF